MANENEVSYLMCSICQVYQEKHSYYFPKSSDVHMFSENEKKDLPKMVFRP